jgi:ADP-ribose pyrophosphatase YjhB (NUDIX family)
MNYCSHCGSAVKQGIPSGDNRLRDICPNCGSIHYQNPKIVTGCVAYWEDKILLCRRAIEPRYGLWTVPAGFMENGETTYQGAARETLEEANARVEVETLYMTVNLPHINQVYMLFRAQLLDQDFSPGAESLATRLCDQQQIPWDELAFPTVSLTLQHYFQDQKSGQFIQRMADIVRNADKPEGYQINYLTT